MRQWIFAICAVVAFPVGEAYALKNKMPDLVVAEDFEPNTKIEAEYGLYWKGFLVTSADIAAGYTDTQYDIALNFRVRGLATLFTGGWTHVRSKGSFTQDDLTQPRHYYATGRWDGEDYAQSMTFDDTGYMADFTMDWPEEWLEDYQREPVPDELKTGADPMSVVLDLTRVSLARAQTGGPATGRVFDGDTVVDMQVTCLPELVVLEESKRSPFYGEALECGFGADLVAGKRILTEKQKEKLEKERLKREKRREKDRKKGKEDEDDDKAPKIWVQSFEDGAFSLPVRAEMSTSLGRAVLYLKSLKVVTKDAQTGDVLESNTGE